MRKFTFLCVILLFTGLQVAFAQQRTITGTVTSKDDGTTMPGVTVVVKATTIGTVTDANGKYHLNGSIKIRYYCCIVCWNETPRSIYRQQNHNRCGIGNRCYEHRGSSCNCPWNFQRKEITRLFDTGN